jgi:transcriptional regulator with XRE-family HTH domain
MGKKKVRSTYHQSILDLFAKQLRKARKARYRSAQQFAHKLGLEPAAYRHYERGDAEPNYETLARICLDLGVTPNDLLLRPPPKSSTMC